MRSKNCINDSSKIAKICSVDHQIQIELTQKAMNEFENRMKTVHSLHPSEQNAVNQNFNMNSIFNINKNDIDIISCTTNHLNKFDNLLILPNKDHKIKTPIIFQTSYKKCQNFVKKTNLKNKIVPHEVFNDILRSKNKKL